MSLIMEMDRFSSSDVPLFLCSFLYFCYFKLFFFFNVFINYSDHVRVCAKVYAMLV